MNECEQFFTQHLSPADQVTILEFALQGLRDELADGLMHERGKLDISDECLEEMLDKLREFMEITQA